jgi:hypothetical protein
MSPSLFGSLIMNNFDMPARPVSRRWFLAGTAAVTSAIASAWLID